MSTAGRPINLLNRWYLLGAIPKEIKLLLLSSRYKTRRNKKRKEIKNGTRESSDTTIIDATFSPSFLLADSCFSNNPSNGLLQ